MWNERISKLLKWKHHLIWSKKEQIVATHSKNTNWCFSGTLGYVKTQITTRIGLRTQSLQNLGFTCAHTGWCFTCTSSTWGSPLHNHVTCPAVSPSCLKELLFLRLPVFLLVSNKVLILSVKKTQKFYSQKFMLVMLLALWELAQLLRKTNTAECHWQLCL